MLKSATAFHNLRTIAIVLANTRKSRKFHCFESLQNFVSFLIKIYSSSLVLDFFAHEVGIVLNMFINF